MTDNALRIIRELTISQSASSAPKIQVSRDASEETSLVSYEREILEDGMPPTDDERLCRVLQEEARRHLGDKGPTLNLRYSINNIQTPAHMSEQHKLADSYKL